MAKINYDFCEDNVLYNSGDIEAEMLDMYKKGETPIGERFFYATTPVRENIVNWYPFKKGAVILEIGGGLGSITGCLCDSAKKVISCEYSKRRAENIYNRHQNRKNLEVVVGNINKVELKEKVDYVVLIGVYEYSKRFFQTQDPFFDFLKLLETFLKPEGVILIAIENRYGIKYWAGATEDHYDIKYLGLEDYGDRDIQTLGKKEITDIVEKTGYKYKFYYPFPDYKMPSVIFTDDRLPQKTELNSLPIYNHGNQLYNFDYRKVLPGIIDNNQFGFFSNSFLLEIGKDNNSFSDVVYAKTSCIRSEKYQNTTVINNKNEIYKIPKGSQGVSHLEVMCGTHKKLEKLNVCVSKIQKKKKRYYIEYIPGINLIEHIYNLTQKRKKDLIFEQIDKYYNLLNSISYSGEIAKFVNQKEKIYFKNKKINILKINLIDLHMGNIIKNKDKLCIIDQEWIVDYDIPMNYVLYYSLNYLSEWVFGFESICPIESLLKKYNINESEIKIYDEMSLYFSSKSLKNVSIDTQKMFINQGVVQMIDKKLKKSIGLLNTTQIELANTRSELENVYNSKRWKIVSNVLDIGRKAVKK